MTGLLNPLILSSEKKKIGHFFCMVLVVCPGYGIFHPADGSSFIYLRRKAYVAKLCDWGGRCSLFTVIAYLLRTSTSSRGQKQKNPCINRCAPNWEDEEPCLPHTREAQYRRIVVCRSSCSYVCAAVLRPYMMLK